MKTWNNQKVTVVGVILTLAMLTFAGFAWNASAQSNDEKAVLNVLMQNTTAFEKNDLATLDKIWANDEAVTVFETVTPTTAGRIIATIISRRR